ncbi:hypothetical protein MUY35_02300 [Aliiroseovarius sp. S1339]|uniref:hypothetical protein n=1 Tax=Aliiroseovarius sp. S1339 TaxID=2936990 RepID=UPI0020BEDACC|nr:hypothetical protein [Aliiroseovarius sp. S1339]MCK8462676.1 hypothetical protein [Aliiroseovarius sp. S1339]
MTTNDQVETLDFGADEGLSTGVRLGLIVLHTDQTIEQERAGIFGAQSDIVLYAARIPNAMDVTPEALR